MLFSSRKPLKLREHNVEATLTVVDLFAGVGGLSLGFIRADDEIEKFRFDLRLLVDSDPSAVFTFKKNFPKIPYWTKDLSQVHGSDILKLTKLKQGDLDFLIGGPPCQGFSQNGKRWLEDNRNRLIARFIEIAHQMRPKCAIIENVPAALSGYEKLFSEEIHDAFRGYVAKTAVLNASAFGVPQIRKRVFVVAVREDLGVSEFDFPKGEYDAIDIGSDSHTQAKAEHRFVSVSEAIGDLPSLKAGQSMDGQPYPTAPESAYQADRRKGSLAIFNHVARSHSKEFLKKIGPIRPGKGNSDLPDDLRFSDNYYSQAYARLHAKGIGFTITANFRNPGSGRFTHYRDKRSLTVREAARLQSFNDRFIFHGYETDQERHVGNAVPPLLAEALARHFGRLLSSA
jgi:DNA (cytosine-5)-methyltransferase 1